MLVHVMKGQEYQGVCVLTGKYFSCVCVWFSFVSEQMSPCYTHTHAHTELIQTRAPTAVSVSVAVLSSHSTSCLSRRLRWMAGQLP